MTATGIAWADGTTYTVTSKAPGDGRLAAIASEVRRAIDGHQIDLVVIEDLPTHAKAAGITGMVHGAVRLQLISLGALYALVAPASLKKYATGKGNCDKAAMAVAAYKRFGRELPDDNQTDALWLRAMGLEHLGHPAADLPAAHRYALAAVRWPGDR
jgi:Holliday junction resolvasome RuvABC endonuclease subunit